MWVLYDITTNYFYQFYCYRGFKYEVRDDTINYGLDFSVVKKLEMSNLLNKGYHLYLDNFINTTKLARYLYENNTWVTETIRLGRKGIPKQLVAIYPVGKVLFCLQMVFREKANKSQFVVLSTNAMADNIRYTIRSGKLIIKTIPQIVYEYNHGIDSTDQMLYTYLDERRASKHYKKSCI